MLFEKIDDNAIFIEFCIEFRWFVEFCLQSFLLVAAVVGHRTITQSVLHEVGWKMVLLPIFNEFLPYKGHLEFSGDFFLAEKVSFDRYNFRITRFSARKPKQMKNF